MCNGLYLHDVADYMGVFSPFVTIAELKFESIIWFVILTGLKFELIMWRSSQVYPLFTNMFGFINSSLLYASSSNFSPASTLIFAITWKSLARLNELRILARLIKPG